MDDALSNLVYYIMYWNLIGVKFLLFTRNDIDTMWVDEEDFFSISLTSQSSCNPVSIFTQHSLLVDDYFKFHHVTYLNTCIEYFNGSKFGPHQKFQCDTSIPSI